MDLQTLKQIQANFLKELESANAGKKTSLPYVINKLPKSNLVKDGETFQVIVTGGTICKEATVNYAGGKTVIKNKQEMPVSPFNTKEDFLEFILKILNKDTKTLALNFTFAIKPTFEKGKLDGILFSASKEHRLEGLYGEKVGVEIEKYVFEKTGRKITVSVGNDTICLLLSALTKYSYDQVSAGVLGTGVNFAIFLDKNSLVNLEAASFDKFPISEEAKEIDKNSTKPGGWLLEKEIAGAYLYKQFNLIVESQMLDYPAINSTAELNTIANNNLGQVSQIAKDLFKKSAQLSAAVIAAITQFQKKDMIFVMEGSLFWFNIENQIGEYLKKLIPQYNVTFAKIENSEILGAAKLVA